MRGGCVTSHALRADTWADWPVDAPRGIEAVRDTHVHFMGIGGIGVSGLARLTLPAAARLSGCDRNVRGPAAALAREGVKVWRRHSPDHLKDVDTLVYSSAVRQTEPEILAARARGIRVVGRLPMLLKLCEDRPMLGVAGAHGKTTTTSLAAALLVNAGLDPSCLVGGITDAFGSNARAGQGEWCVVELDESDGYIAEAACRIAVLTNVDREHFEHYDDFESICRSFRSYLEATSDDGVVIACADSMPARALARACARRVLTYGLTAEADVRAEDVRLGPSSSTFRAVGPDGIVGEVTLGLAGIHNVQNAMAAVAVALELGIERDVLLRTLASAPRVGRRMESRALGRGIRAVVDYAHHPAKVAATISAVRLSAPGRVVAVFQPHRYTRTLHLGEEFGPAFGGEPPRHLAGAATRPVDRLLVLPIYSASEDPIPGVTGEIVARAATRAGVNASYVRSREAVLHELAVTLRSDDTLLVLGAGDVDELVEELRGRL
jgi:UDP-N-acetylmuramate--alanine ligase